jgi:hypothetical protein
MTSRAASAADVRWFLSFPSLATSNACQLVFRILRHVRIATHILPLAAMSRLPLSISDF